MKKTKLIVAIVSVALILSGGILWASDHADAPNVKTKSTDITDLYVFQGADVNNLVFVGNVQGLMSPVTTQTAAFDENTMIEFKIDNSGDHVEDLVIQCVYKGGKMYIYGPVKPGTTGLSSTVMGTAIVAVAVTPYTATTPIIASAYGITAFAGPRDDPFFFDLDQFHKITGGTATGFVDPGTDTFKGTNVMSVVVEVPKSLLNSTGKIDVWLQTKQKV
ncbi:protein of unknown function [Chitinophaga sp. CF118]|uniref:DUF4331 family protein n=1 Tax=Chitinophaga sp. CF118 TaxID=1884367 RepID=UPI0008F02C53|nr:DUF4331 family protein [Chitinophaga sp. CF118]SFE50812.1 protein of unknown function [Chitinophaga sp. CF118]